MIPLFNPHLIRGVSVTLYVRTDTGERDAFGRAVVTETPTVVDNVLIQPLQRTTDVPTEETNITGEKTSYILGIPKTDAHDWKNCRVAFFGEIFRTESAEWQGIASMIPGDWNRKICCRKYD